MRFLALPNGAAMALLAGVAALVIALYLLRPAPRRLAVPSGVLWERVLRSRKRRPERWRWWLSLLLALSIALALALALARPEVAAVSGAARELVIVVDNSATMTARSADGRTRFEQALRLAREAIEAGGPGSRFMVADTLRQIATPRFEERESALGTLGGLSAQAAGTPVFPDVARPLDARSNLEVLFVSDGVGGVVPPPGVRTLSAFKPADNVGIGAFEVRAVPGDSARYQAFVEVLNASAGTARVELRISGAGARPMTRTLQLAGNGRAAEVLDVSAFDGGVLRASVDRPSDAFDPDNSAYALLPMKRVIRVALVTHGNPALEQALGRSPRVQITLIAPERFGSGRGFDAVVFDRFAPRAQPALAALLVRPDPAPWLPKGGGESADLVVERWEARHPLLRDLSLRDLIVDRATRLRLDAADASGALRAIASGPRGEPLILAADAGARWAQLAFALEDSNFAQLPSFPVFISNTVEWLTGETAALIEGLGRVRVPLQGARVSDLAGASVQAASGSGATWFDAREPGVYTATASGARVRVVVNALDPRRTLLNVSPLSDVAREAAPARPAPLRADPWVLLLGAALTLLCLEWVAFHRRVTV